LVFQNNIDFYVLLLRCFVGKRRLEKAISTYQTSHPDTKFDIKWHPFELDPTLTKTPVNKLDRYAAKFGAARVGSLVEHMKQTGKGDGINFSYGGTIANTIDSHRLIEWATEQGKQDEIVEQLFKLYFEEEGNIADHDQLADVAGKIGLDRAEVCFPFKFLRT
jgi:predicted DsbA family dithiol-disulfide isomerase